MLFNSVAFILMFLPAVLAGYFLLGARSPSLACLWLVAASFFFYGWWDSRYLALLTISIIGNFTLGHAISACQMDFGIQVNRERLDNHIHFLRDGK